MWLSTSTITYPHLQHNAFTKDPLKLLGHFQRLLSLRASELRSGGPSQHLGPEEESGTQGLAVLLHYTTSLGEGRVVCCLVSLRPILVFSPMKSCFHKVEVTCLPAACPKQ